MIGFSIFSPEQQEISDGDEENCEKVQENDKHGVRPGCLSVTIRKKKWERKPCDSSRIRSYEILRFGSIFLINFENFTHNLWKQDRMQIQIDHFGGTFTNPVFDEVLGLPK